MAADMSLLLSHQVADVILLEEVVMLAV